MECFRDIYPDISLYTLHLKEETERHLSTSFLLPCVLPELTVLSWWHRGPDAENLCQRCLCSSDSICPAYRFPSALPQLMAVNSVLSLHFSCPANGAKVSTPHIIIADRPPSPLGWECVSFKRARQTGERDLFVNMRDDLITQKHNIGNSYVHIKHEPVWRLKCPYYADLQVHNFILESAKLNLHDLK